MTYAQFIRQFAKEQAVSKREAEALLADRARIVANLSGVEFGGIDNRGVLFVTSWLEGRIINAPTQFFDFETVIDGPSQVGEWARGIRERSEAIRCQ